MSSKIQLYSLATPNGQKVAIALEEMQIPYQAHTINIMENDQFKPDFIKVNPNSKIPAIVDPGANKGEDFAVFESGAILIYLAEKSQKFLSSDLYERSKTLQWLMFQMGGVGPIFGQFGHFYKYAKDTCKDPYPVERYTKEAKRLLQVIDTRLANAPYLSGKELSIADFATLPWIVAVDQFYGAKDELDLDGFKYIQDWKGALLDRPAVIRGMQANPFPNKK